MKLLRIALVSAGLAVALGGMAAPAWADGDAARGKKVFNKCKACHKLVAKKKAIGPSLHGIFGRTAGTYDGFKFSKDMQAAGSKGLVWTEKTLDEFLANPKGFVGAKVGKKRASIKMAFAGVKKDKERDDLIAYLKEATK